MLTHIVILGFSLFTDFNSNTYYTEKFVENLQTTWNETEDERRKNERQFI